MKKTFIYIAFAVVAISAAVLAVSCVRELEYPRSLSGSGAELRLTPVCEDLATKAETIAGDDTYNEKKIDGYYWFIYADANGTAHRLSGYVGDGSDKIIPLDAQFPIAPGNDGYVYVVANLPQKPESPAKGDEWFEWNEANHQIKHFVQGETGASSDKSYGPAVADLKTISFGKNTPLSSSGSIAAGQSEFYNYTSSTTGVPKPERFVMRLDAPVKFSVTDLKTPVEVTASLKRIAAKIVLDLYVAKSVKQMETTASGTEVYKKTWDADPSHIQIYMLWGSTHGDLTGTPIHYGDDGVNPSWFYSASPRYAMYSNPEGGNFNGTGIEGAVDAALYETVNYPVMTTVMDYVYIVNEGDGDQGWNWNGNVPSDATSDWKNTHRGDYYYGDWAYVLDGGGNKQIKTYTEDGQTKQERHATTQTTVKPYYHYKVDKVPPLYTMPISWNVNEAHAPFIKVILPWQGRYEEAVDGHAAGETDGKTTEFYYKILIPEMTKLDANNCYHIKLDLSVLGSSADEVPVEVSGKYHVIPWDVPAEMGGDQAAGRFLDVPTELEFYSVASMDIPVRSSHDIEVVLTGTNAPVASYNNYSRDDGVTTISTLTRDDEETTGDYYTIAASGREKVTITHTQETRLEYLASRDVARIYYKFRVQHKNYPTIYKDVKVVQYPSLYIEADPNTGYRDRRNAQGNQASNGSYRSGYTFVNTRNYIFGNNWYNTSGLYNSSNSNSNMYVVTTKVLSNTDQVIGDPRTRATSDITDFIGTPPTGSDEGVLSPPATAWQFAPALTGPNVRQLSEGYLQAESSDRTLNMIAPGLRVASSFGATQPFNFATATRRCAGYQEDGRAAGRWRLPTAAEIEYLVNLSAKSLLPRLFGSATGSTTYWSANGTCTVSGQNVTVSNGTFTGSHYVRCVYDEWYWGKEVLADPNQFTWGDEYPE